MAVHIARHLFTVDEYYKMAENGVLTEDSRVELIEGEIVDMPPIGSGHASSVDRTGDRLRATLGGIASVRTQQPLNLGQRSEPEPDLAIVGRRDDYYASAHPTPADVLLLVEVSDTSLAYDRETKGPLYARAGIADYWILNLVDRQLEVFREPTAAGYADVQVLVPGDAVQPLSFPTISIAVSSLLG
jgi:Uma2 family endonuclease